MSKIKQPTKAEILDMLEQSNAIEQVHGAEALKDAYTAWKYGAKNQNITDPTDVVNAPTVQGILGIHKRLMKNLYPQIAGKIRNCDVYIGGQRHWFLTERIIIDELAEICFDMDMAINKKMTDKDKDEFTKECHVRFENCHPFIDGNGRTGRILYNLHRLKLGLPIHTIHADWPLLDGEQRSYHEWFRR